MVAIGRASCALMVVLACSACGGTSDDDDTNSSAGGSSPGGTSNQGGSSGKGGSSSQGGGSSQGGSSAGGQSSGGDSSSGGSSAAGSGGSNTGGSESVGPGTVTDLWSNFCIATFTEDYMVEDAFGDPIFTAQSGEEYLLLDYPSPYTHATAAYLTSSGPLDFDIAPNVDHTAFPFTSNCAPDPPLWYFAAFADVSVYAEPELVTKICDLEAGATVLRDGSGAGYGLESLGGDGAIYEIFLNAFSASCGGAGTGYISVKTIHLFDSDRILVPFDSIVAEN